MVKIINSIFLLIFFLASSCVSLTQAPAYSINDIIIYQSLGGVSAKLQQEFNEKNVELIYLINGAYIEGKQKYQIDKKKLSQRLDQILPDKMTQVVMVLDVEGVYMADLAKPDTKEFENALKFYIDVYEYSKSLRPKATIGFYGLPWRHYYNRDVQWRSKNETLEPLLSKVDALFPSIYDFYVLGKDRVTMESELAYVEDNTVEALRLGEKFNKPVFPFVWHRYHTSNTHKPRENIDKDEFYAHIKQIAESTYNDNHVDGIVWWSSERYYYNVSDLAKKSKNKDQTFNQLIDRDLTPYFNVFQKALHDAENTK